MTSGRIEQEEAWQRLMQLQPGPQTLVALDIDGTIIGHDGQLSARVRAAITALEAAGTHVILSTGRSVVAVTPIIEELGLQAGSAVCSNGAVTISYERDESGTLRHRMEEVITFDPGPAVRLLREHAPEAIFAVEDLGRGFRVTAPFPEGELSGELSVVTFEELVALPATRVTLRAPEWGAEAFHDLIVRSGLHGVSYAVGWSAWLDLNPEGVSKASALEELRQRLSVESSRTVAVGDGRNDIEMLRWAGVGVAMGGAEADTRAAANLDTEAVELDGLVPVLQAVLAGASTSTSWAGP